MLLWVLSIGLLNIQDGFNMKDIFNDDNFHIIALINAFFVYCVLLPAYWIFVG